MTEAEKFLENIKRAKTDYCKKHGLPIPEFKSESDFYISDEEWREMKGKETPSTQFCKGGSMTRESLLNRAIECVCGEREQDYGSPEDNFSLIAELWESYINRRCVPPNVGICIVAEDVAVMMALLKIARIATGTATDDSWVDLAGYAACGGEIASWRRKAIGMKPSDPLTDSQKVYDLMNGVQHETH